MADSTRISATDNGDGTATIAIVDDGHTLTFTLDRERLLDQIVAADAALRWSACRAADQRHRLWGLVSAAVEQQVGRQSEAMRTGPERIRVQSEQWDNGHFASDSVEVWFGPADPAMVWDKADATVEIRDLSTTIDFAIFDGCSEGAAWTLDMGRTDLMSKAA